MNSSTNKTSSSSPFGNFDENLDLWTQQWTSIADEAQKAWRINLSEWPNFSNGGLTNTLFDPEVVGETFIKGMEKMLEKPEKIVNLQVRHLTEFQELLQSTLHKLQGTTLKEFTKTTFKDKRFKDSTWSNNPFFSLLQQSYLLNAKFVKDAVESIEGLDPITKSKLKFYTSHIIDAFSPTNFPLTNPTVIQETLNTAGSNLIRGFKKYVEDASNGQWYNNMTDMNAFHLGKDLATTPGKVVFQNDIFQLIQYTPLTSRVAKIPLLIIPAWINKYYIFDLKPENSFIRWALESGLTVFIISWVNPDKSHAHKSITDYTLDGVKKAVDQVCELTGEKKVNALGYCSGGFLLYCLMAYMKKKKINSIESATLLTSSVDFENADEFRIYRCELQQRKLEEYVQKKGFLDGRYMVQSFSLLRANDLIWSSYINNYLLGLEPFPFDMLYWNCDALRMPAKMHMDYLREIVINNKLMKPNSFSIKDVPIDLSKITLPLYIMAAHDDHIASWQSVYPVTQLVKSPTKQFVLGASGHVAGAMNHPSLQKYHYWTSDDLPKEPEKWLEGAQKHPGSWWEHWRQWLDNHSEGTIPARAIPQERILQDAPGSYVLAVS